MKFNLLARWMEYREIRDSGLFDPDHYISQYPKDPRARKHPIRHYMDTGWKDKKNPSRHFDTAFYLRMNPDVRQAGINPLAHYIQHGRSEGRSPRAGQFDPPVAQYHRPKFGDRLIRFIYQVGKTLSWKIPARYRQRMVIQAKAWFGLLLGARFADSNPTGPGGVLAPGSVMQSRLVDLDTVEPSRSAGGSIAIHIHLFYPAMRAEFERYLKNMPFPYDLYLSLPEGEPVDAYQQTFGSLPLCKKVEVKVVPNRGRDLAPFFCTFGGQLASYDFVAHLHSKKSAYNQGATTGWRKYLCHNLMGSPDTIRRIFSLLQGGHGFGLVYPQNFARLPYWANTWLANRTAGGEWCARLGIRDVPRGYFDYPASSMFWARTEVLAPLFNSGLTLEAFPEERGQTDGTLAHTLERLFALCAVKQGFQPAILADRAHPSWSAWRFDRYLDRPAEEFLRLAASPQVKVIAFDIFDTLFCRPVLDPGSIKNLVAGRLPVGPGRLYLQARNRAEVGARDRKGRDVHLDEILEVMGEITGLPRNALDEIRETEIAVEEACLEVRPGIADWIQAALGTGKPVVLISDMFLPEKVIHRWLKRFGLAGWDAIFISGDQGARKEDRALYDRVFQRYGILPGELLMVGDNERSDVQVPCDMGASFQHVMRPVELARGTPRFAPLISTHEAQPDLDAELTLGLVVRRNFAPVHLTGYHPGALIHVSPYHWGYSLVGPLLTGFSEWLLRQSNADGFTRLYFLAREGKLMQQVYDAWSQGNPSAPASSYLVLSRRAAGVAAITSGDDIQAIAKTTYYPNRLADFLHTRYGISPTVDRWQELEHKHAFTANSEISVQEQDIRDILPVLALFEPEILTRAKSERTALLQHLDVLGLNQAGQPAIVDIGYGGSVQAYLNRLLGRKVHGCYLMTEERANAIAGRYDVHLRACYHDSIARDAAVPILYQHSFEIEKLLSSDDAQVEYYEVDKHGKVRGCFRALTSEETASNDIRLPIRKGAMDFVRDALQVRRTIKPDFQPSCRSAEALMNAFLTQPATSEKQLLASIILDDHYCGRGLVS